MTSSTVIALDVGEKRIGVAIANVIARIPGPLVTLENNANTLATLQRLIADNDTAVLVCGLPRGLDGQHTAQTAAVETFGKMVQQAIPLPFYWQDEALTSRKAEAELTSRGRPFRKEDIDALAATYILEDFLGEHSEITA